MKKNILTIALSTLFITGFVFKISAQVGVNTKTPQEILHVKGSMIFEPTVTGSNPAAATGKILTSDANGNATWRNMNLPLNPSVTANYSTTGVTFTKTGSGISNAVYTGTSITLPPGTWIVSFSMDGKVTMENGSALANNRAVWLRSSLFESTTAEAYTNSSPDIQDRPLISKDLTGPATNTIMIGEFKVKNSGTTNKTYYYKVSVENTNFSNNEVSQVIGFGSGPEQSTSNRLFATIAKYPQ